MEYPSKPEMRKFLNGTTRMTYSCDKCRRYAEHLGYQIRTTRCRYCDFQFEEEGHMVYLDAYNKIQFAGFKEYKMILLAHALKEHPEHFGKNKIKVQ